VDQPPELRAAGVLLRAFQVSDADDRLAAGIDPEAVRMYGGDYRNPAPMTAERAERWLEQRRTEPTTWAIEVDGRCVGHVRLRDDPLGTRAALLSIGIFQPGMRGRGIGTAAMRLVLRHGFETLGIHRVGLRVLAYNHRAIAAYRKCGFVEEGRLRSVLYLDDAWHDDLLMAILEEEYRAVAPSWVDG
jgi:[ribosomal protein S5]-alanine N-acetyltransferase